MITGGVLCRPPLTHSYPQWEPPDSDPYAPAEEYVQTWTGRMRIVRNRRRMRKLKRRGVPLMDFVSTVGTGSDHVTAWAWFIE